MNALISRVWHDSLYRFLIILLAVFSCLYYFNQFYIGITAPENIYIPFLDQHLNYISGLRYVLMHSSAWVLEQFGFSTFTTDYWLRVSGRGGVVVVYSCLGFGVMSFFTAFVIAWPKSLKSKAWFLPVGLLLIQLLNITRFILLSLYWKKSAFRGVIDHHDLFNIILYLILLCVIYLWAHKDKHQHAKN